MFNLIWYSSICFDLFLVLPQKNMPLFILVHHASFASFYSILFVGGTFSFIAQCYKKCRIKKGLILSVKNAFQYLTFFKYKKTALFSDNPFEQTGVTRLNPFLFSVPPLRIAPPFYAPLHKRPAGASWLPETKRRPAIPFPTTPKADYRAYSQIPPY